MAESDPEKVGYSLTIDGKYHNMLDLEGFFHMMKDPYKEAAFLQSIYERMM